MTDVTVRCRQNEKQTSGSQSRSSVFHLFLFRGTGCVCFGGLRSNRSGQDII